MSLNGGLIKARWTGKKYRTPEAWRVLEEPQPLHTVPLRDALNTHFYDIPEEVWILPLHSLQGSVVRPSKGGPPEMIKSELGIELKSSAVFVDLDHGPAHKLNQVITIQDREALKTALIRFKTLRGWFFHFTQRGARCGLLFAEPVDLDHLAYIKLELFAQLDQALQNLSAWYVDRQAAELNRCFAAPHINKKGEPLEPSFVELWIHEEDLALEHAQRIAAAYQARRTRIRGSEAPAGESKEAGDRAPRNRQNKKRVIIPSAQAVAELDNTEQYNLTLSAFTSISQIVRHSALREDILKLLDKHLMDSRRATKEPRWFENVLNSTLNMIPLSDAASIGEALPLPVEVGEGLRPLARVWESGDEAALSEALYDVHDQEHTRPLWHGSGLRRYDESAGVWRLYTHHHLKRVALQAQGARYEDSKKVSLSNSKVEGAIRLLAAKCGAGEDSIFDEAPRGVVIGPHFVSSCPHNGLKVEAPRSHHYAIHKLDHTIPEEVLKFWETDGDEGRAPRRPPVFTKTFLSRCLVREPGSHEETQEQSAQEIEAKIFTIGQWLGLALLGACTSEAVALIVHGQGSNGKSVLLDVISDLFGAERVATLAPQKMKDRFSRAQLLGAAINCVSEMPENDLIDSSTMKAIISGDRIESEFKHQPIFTFKPRAAHIFSANNLPSSRDRSHGFWRRLIPIEFTHVFSDDEKDRNMIHKLKAEYHLIVPWALNCARDYYIERRFRYMDYINTWRMFWRRQVDHVALYVDERLEATESARGGTALKEIWADFITWATDTGASGAAKMSLIAFGRLLAQLPNVEKGRYGKQRTTKINQKIKTQVEAAPWQTTH